MIEPGVDPDDTYNETPYEKGFAFVSYLQHLVGDVAKFDDFLKAYVDKYKHKVNMGWRGVGVERKRLVLIVYLQHLAGDAANFDVFLKVYLYIKVNIW